MSDTHLDSGRHAHPMLFMWLVVPYGVVSGFLTVAVAYHLAQAGVAEEKIGALIALSYLPHTWKFLWAPVVDLRGRRSTWYIASSLMMALSMAAMGWLGETDGHWGVLTAAVLLANLACTFMGMSIEIMMAHGVADDKKARAAGWFQAGNLGSLGLGGGLGLWLSEHVMSLSHVGMLMGAACLLTMLALRWVPSEHLQASKWHGSNRLSDHIRHLGDDIWSLMRSSKGLLVLSVCFLPIGCGAASNLWSVMAGEWQASGDTVAVVNGALNGVVSALGCLIGGIACDRYGRIKAYCAFGVILALVAVGMAISPRTALMYALFASAYNMVVGMNYAGFTALTLEAIGKGAAATKYNVLASLSNMPIAYMTAVNGWSMAKYGGGGMLWIEAGVGALGLLVFLLIAALVSRFHPDRRVKEPEAAAAVY